MLRSGHPMFLFIPNPSNARILYPGRVIATEGESFVVEFEQPVAPQPGTDVNAYAEVRGKFLQQGAVVTEIRQTQPASIIAFKRAGEPISAEQRQLFRIVVVTVDIIARIDSERKCAVVDVSPVGFAAIAAKKYKVGSLVQVSLTADEHSLAATARVQTIKNLPDGKFRYGFLVPKSNEAARKTLQQLSTIAQRRQLRRLAGAA